MGADVPVRSSVVPSESPSRSCSGAMSRLLQPFLSSGPSQLSQTPSVAELEGALGRTHPIPFTSQTRKPRQGHTASQTRAPVCIPPGVFWMGMEGRKSPGPSCPLCFPCLCLHQLGELSPPAPPPFRLPRPLQWREGGGRHQSCLWGKAAPVGIGPGHSLVAS